MFANNFFHFGLTTHLREGSETVDAKRRSHDFEAMPSIPPRLPKAERGKVYLLGKPSVKAAIVSDNIVQHPTRGRAADYQKDIPLFRCPAVPEISEFLNKLRRFRPGKPWKFVYEYDFPAAAIQRKEFFQKVESVKPIFRLLVGGVQSNPAGCDRNA